VTNAVRLFAVYFRVGAMNELQYRANFVVQLFQSMLALATGLVVLALVFNHTESLGGWSQPELLAVMGVHFLVGGLIRTLIQPNMERIMSDVERGTLDYALTKPVDAQLLVSVREVRIWQAVDVVTGVVVLAVALRRLGGLVGLEDALGFVAALVLGALTIYSFWLLITTSAFWFIRVGEVTELFGSFYQAGRWPVGLYPDWLRLSLTFLVPLAFAVTVPAEALTERLTVATLAVSVVLAFGMAGLARYVWKRGLRRYGSASS
jgi:ABC-2 type transport system permease protein